MDPKTPVSLLQEYLARLRLPSPKYSLIFDGNGTHQPVFQYEVKAKGLSEIGTGGSKKEAKHEAAKLLLLRLKGKDILKNETPLIGKDILKNETPLILPHSPGILGNPIGELQEFCVANSFLKPVYEFFKDKGNMFVATCTVGPYSADGTAPSKQQAKHLAASGVLKIFLGNEKKVIDLSVYKVVEKQTHTAKACDKTIELFQNPVHDREHSPTSTMKNLLKFAENLKRKIGPRSLALQSIFDMDDESIENLPQPQDKFDSIMSELGYEPKYEFLQTKTRDHSLCNLVVKELNINCIGIGKSNNDAMKKAVINSLKLLVVMFKS